MLSLLLFFFFQAEDGIRDGHVTGVQTCALPIFLPGANAALCALVGSGLSTDKFYFYGFLPRKNKERKEAWEELNRQEGTILLYESPYRVKDTLKDIKKNLGNQIGRASCRERGKRRG